MNRNVGHSERAVAIDASVSDQTVNPGNRALYIGVAGDIVVQMRNGAPDVTFTCPAGVILPIEVAIVRNTGTTASGIVALY